MKIIQNILKPLYESEFTTELKSWYFIIVILSILPYPEYCSKNIFWYSAIYDLYYERRKTFAYLLSQS